MVAARLACQPRIAEAVYREWAQAVVDGAAWSDSSAGVVPAGLGARNGAATCAYAQAAWVHHSIGLATGDGITA